MSQHALLTVTADLEIEASAPHSGQHVKLRLNRIVAQKLGNCLLEYAAGRSKHKSGGLSFRTSVIGTDESPMSDGRRDSKQRAAAAAKPVRIKKQLPVVRLR